MSELWDLYDMHRELTGETWKRGTKTPIPKGRYHIIVSVWTVTPSGKILITQRHPHKSFGELWENTGGAVIAGETSLDAAYRELSEEIGLDVDKDRLVMLGDVWHSGYVVDTYLYVSEIDIDKLVLQDDEVIDAKLVSEADIDSLHEQNMMVPSVYRTFCCYRQEINALIKNN